MSGGSPFQTFFLMFKSNSKEAKKDMEDLGKTSENVEKKIKKTKEETSELGKAFTDAVENGMRALAAYASFNAFKSGIVNAQEFNRALTIQTKLWGQSANEIAGYGNAVKAVGGDIQGLMGWYDKARQGAVAAGKKPLSIGQTMEKIREQVRGLGTEAAQQIFGRLGIADAGMQSLLLLSDEEYSKAIEQGKELAANTEAGATASQKFGTSWDNLTGSLTKFWTTVNTVILPPLAALLDGLTALFNNIANNKVGATAFFVGMAAAALAFTASIPAIVAGFGSISTAALAAMPAMAAFLGQFAAIAAVSYGVVEGASAAGAGLGHWINRLRGKGDKNGVLPGHPGYLGGAGAGTATSGAGSGSAMDYLMQKHGLNSSQAAAIVANMNAESSGNINAVGDGGLARGLFQWHPDRRAKILAGTGIDVANAPMNSQLDAMMWELGQRGQLDKFKAQQSPDAAAAYFADKFEVHGGGLAETMKRGRMAMDIAGSTPFASQGNSSSSSISIGKIDVNTQATDAAGIARDLHTALESQINGVYAQQNDAVAY